MAQRILLAEDEPNIVTSLVFLLERAGFAIEAYGNGSEALSAALASPPDIIVLDRMLPGTDGLEVLRKLRLDDGCRNLPVIMLTAKGQQEDRDAAMAAGASLFITKPFANADVVTAVNSFANNRAD